MAAKIAPSSISIWRTTERKGKKEGGRKVVKGKGRGRGRGKEGKRRGNRREGKGREEKGR